MKKKRPPLKKRQSFTECGMKFQDGAEMREKFRAKQTGPNLIEAFTIS